MVRGSVDVQVETLRLTAVESRPFAAISRFQCISSDDLASSADTFAVGQRFLVCILFIIQQGQGRIFAGKKGNNLYGLMYFTAKIT
jgi:hypothetical protein